MLRSLGVGHLANVTLVDGRVALERGDMTPCIAELPPVTADWRFLLAYIRETPP